MAFLFQDQNQGIRNVGAHAKAIRVKRRKPFSSIRTLTVGFGVAPNLLTLPLLGEEGARGLGRCRPYRRWGLSPRPENIGRPVWNGLCGTIRHAWARARGWATRRRHVPMPENRISEAAPGPENGPANSLTNCKHCDSDSVLFPN